MSFAYAIWYIASYHRYMFTCPINVTTGSTVHMSIHMSIHTPALMSIEVSAVHVCTPYLRHLSVPHIYGSGLSGSKHPLPPTRQPHMADTINLDHASEHTTADRSTVYGRPQHYRASEHTIAVPDRWRLLWADCRADVRRWHRQHLPAKLCVSVGATHQRWYATRHARLQHYSNRSGRAG